MARSRFARWPILFSFLAGGLLAGLAAVCVAREADAALPLRHHSPHGGEGHPIVHVESYPAGEWAGSWYWQRSPEQEQRVVAGLYNRYCIRCHGVDGRGVWDIPDVPDFTNARWQVSRSDAQLARLILEGRGAVMPAFRGTLALEEAWAVGRYLRTFDPAAAVPRPDYREPPK